jgi:hypothetical protein
MAKHPPASGANWKPHLKDVEGLHLDPRNPRLAEADLGPKPTGPAIVAALWKNMAVDEVALSIAENGFYQHEPLFATREGGKVYVIEGNRRLAAVMLLRDPALRKQIGATGLPDITAEAKANLSQLPVIECSREDVWAFLGFKHINGPQSWESYPKAHYIAWVRNDLGVSLDQIASRIGDKHSTVVRLYDALMVLQQAETSGVFDREDRFKKHFSFSHLMTGLGYVGIRKFLGLSVSDKNIGKESPVPKKHERALGELLLWMFGRKSDAVSPLIRSQNPDLRQLDQILLSEHGTVALRKGLPLKVSLEISQGDERVFREALVTAKQSLQKARGTVLTGFSDNQDLLHMAREISELADALVSDMDSGHGSSDKRTRRGKQ